MGVPPSLGRPPNGPAEPALPAPEGKVAKVLDYLVARTCFSGYRGLGSTAPTLTKPNPPRWLDAWQENPVANIVAPGLGFKV